MPKEFLISDESLNSYGFKVQTSGINLKQFRKNPIGYYNHDRESGVICRWENLRTEGKKMYATPVFDLNDPLGAKIALKVENGFIKAASIGAEHAVFDEIKGETVVTACDLYEISICDLPSNKNALALYVNDKVITDKNEIVKLSTNQKDMKTDLTPITNILGLKANTSVSDIANAISILKDTKSPKAMIKEAIDLKLIAPYEVEELHLLANANPDAFTKYLNKRKQKVLDERQEEGLKLVNTAFREGRLNADGAGKVQSFWLNAFKIDFEGAKTALDKLPKRVSVMEYLSQNSDSEGRENWTLSDYRKKAPKELQKNPALYQKLLEDEKGKMTV